MERQRHLPSASSLSTSPGLGVGRADVRSFLWISHMDGPGPSTWAIFIAFPGVLSVAGLELQQPGHKPMLIWDGCVAGVGMMPALASRFLSPDFWGFINM